MYFSTFPSQQGLLGKHIFGGVPRGVLFGFDIKYYSRMTVWFNMSLLIFYQWNPPFKILTITQENLGWTTKGTPTIYFSKKVAKSPLNNFTKTNSYIKILGFEHYFWQKGVQFFQASWAVPLFQPAWSRKGTLFANIKLLNLNKSLIMNKK